MSTGAYISGAAHLALILALLLGGVFDRSRLPEMSVADVSVIPAEEFAALTRPDAAPQVTQEAATPEAPTPDAAPELAALPAPPTPQ